MKNRNENMNKNFGIYMKPGRKGQTARGRATDWANVTLS